MEAIPPARGISFGLVGKLKSLFRRLQTVTLRVCSLSAFELRNKRKIRFDRFIVQSLLSASVEN